MIDIEEPLNNSEKPSRELSCSSHRAYFRLRSIRGGPCDRIFGKGVLGHFGAVEIESRA